MMLKNKRLRLLALTLTIVIALLSLASCSGESDDAGSVRIVICDEIAVEYTVDLSLLGEGDGVIPALDYLKANEGVDYTSNDGGYGAYLTTLGTLRENAQEGKFLYVYTSVAADFDVSAYAMTVEYDGVTLTSSGVGISEMTLTDGAIIYITYITYR